MKIKSLLLSTAAAASLFVLGTTAANADTVTVQAGDTVSALAETHNTTISAIESANSLKNVNLIFVGQQLEINGTAAQAPVQSQAPASQAPASQAQSQAPASQAQSQAPASQAVQSAAVQSQAPASQAQSQAPVQSQAASQAPASQAQSQAPVQSQAPASQAAAPTVTSGTSDSAAKAWIANKESGGSYTARNGQYVGKYQLSASYLNGDHSAANQERVAENYVSSRYGSWTAAKNFWMSNGWY
ncbi:aggregation-promoting factor [Lactiplantibacillus modestisalitolerans]|uniref:LysM peptidoglycan-binding domain-containing protein n=1 Tax=Lactiplantibacillus modestisalitolerans TaxID=1457219 RepID=A0ABV5WUW7_9LACO|nr:LysM domain-containing protein [Lactiplantibacillus modestisalitolerans]